MLAMLPLWFMPPVRDTLFLRHAIDIHTYLRGIALKTGYCLVALKRVICLIYFIFFIN
ncbi:MAG: hypothetical protein K0S17_446 [Enterobacter mori]|jgi:hypothetical protein|nr:hypothetical protein [Enterobacter mori]